MLTNVTSEAVASAALGTDHTAVELTQASEEELGGTNEETVYTSAISEFTLMHDIVCCGR